MKIRGDSSVIGKSSPLVIIEGITGSLDELNAMDASDIQNISVLKDASAAIYGARSASGVESPFQPRHSIFLQIPDHQSHIPVSYTHLGVIKRSAFTSVCLRW